MFEIHLFVYFQNQRRIISDGPAVVELMNLVLQNYIPRRFKIQLRLVIFQNAMKPNTVARSATNT